MAKKNNQKLKNQIFIPWFTMGLILIQVCLFFWEKRANRVGLLGPLFSEYGFSWEAFCQHPWAESPTLISYTLIHGSLSHLLTNLFVFAVFAPAVEQVLGPVLFFIFYFFCGSCAALIQGAFTPFSEASIGSSGAISGVMGAFLIFYPMQAPPFFITNLMGGFVKKIPVFFWVSLYFILQLKYGFLSLQSQNESNVGYWAHLGGFSMGVIGAFLFAETFGQVKVKSLE